MPGPITTTFTRRPKTKRAKLVWAGAQHAIGKPPHSIKMIPNKRFGGVRTTRWIISRYEQDLNPIVVDAPAKKAYNLLLDMVVA